MSAGAALFWSLVALWWAVDIYVLVLKKNGYHKILERRSKFVIIVLILAGVVLAVAPESFREVWRTRPFGPFQWIGTTVLAMGIFVRFSAIFTLGRHFTPDIGVLKRKQLISRGLYRWVRHPSYTGEIVAFTGVGIVFQHVPSSFFIIAFPALAFIYRAFVEEKKLMEEFGAEYLEYKERTRMFI